MASSALRCAARAPMRRFPAETLIVHDGRHPRCSPRRLRGDDRRRQRADPCAIASGSARAASRAISGPDRPQDPRASAYCWLCVDGGTGSQARTAPPITTSRALRSMTATHDPECADSAFTCPRRRIHAAGSRLPCTTPGPHPRAELRAASRRLTWPPSPPTGGAPPQLCAAGRESTNGPACRPVRAPVANDRGT